MLKPSTRTFEVPTLIVQGGLEIPVQVTAEMDLTEGTRQYLKSINRLSIQIAKNPG